jgi:hypothetical protein
MAIVGRLGITLVISLVAVALGATGALALARRRGVSLPVGRLRAMIVLLVAVVVVSTLAAPYLASVPQVFGALDIVEAIGGAVLAAYAFRLWQQSGWTGMT